MSKISNQILISHSPNTEWDDVITSIKSLFISKQSNLNRLKLRLQELFNYKNVLLLDSGRSAIYIALKSMGINNDDEVIMQGFNCVAVYNAINWTGAKPVLVDINKKTLAIDIKNLKSKITKKTRAVIIQHTFGYVSNINEILTLCKSHNLVTIEDCTHMLGNKYNGTFVGNNCDFGILSYGRDKSFGTGIGGALVVNDIMYLKNTEDIYSGLGYPSFNTRKREIIYPLIMKLLVRPLFFKFNIGKAILYLGQRIGLITKSSTNEEKAVGDKPKSFPSKMSGDLASVILHQLSKYDKFQVHRIKLAGIYQNELSSHNVFPESIIQNQYLLRYPIIVKNSTALISHLYSAHNIHLGDWYNQVISPREVDLKKLEYNNDCKVAEEVGNMIVNLPLNIETSPEDAIYLSKLILEHINNG